MWYSSCILCATFSSKTWKPTPAVNRRAEKQSGRTQIKYTNCLNSTKMHLHTYPSEKLLIYWMLLLSWSTFKPTFKFKGGWNDGLWVRTLKFSALQINNVITRSVVMLKLYMFSPYLASPLLLTAVEVSPPPHDPSRWPYSRLWLHPLETNKT